MRLKFLCYHICFMSLLISILYTIFAYTHFLFAKGNVNKVATQLLSDYDPSICHNKSLVQLITHGTASEYNQVMHILNEKGPLCLRFILEAIKTELDQYNRIPSTCEGLIGQDQLSCQRLQVEYAVVSERVLSLVNLMVSQQPHLIEPFMLQLEYASSGAYMNNTRLFDLLQDLEDRQSCSDYKIGEERHFIITPYQSNILRYVHYRVRRESEKHYKAFLVLEFSADSSYQDRPVSKEDVHDHYIEVVGKCIDRANSDMKGPNGEKLEIVIEDARQADSYMPTRLIKIGSFPEGEMITATRYKALGMHCANYTHEIEHLLGLWDERRSSEHDCRATYGANSMLSYALNRWLGVRNQRDKSLLDPSHFQAILYGNCSLRNDVNLYRMCSRLAYQNSNNNPSCLQEKAYCESQDVLGRNKITK